MNRISLQCSHTHCGGVVDLSELPAMCWRRTCLLSSFFSISSPITRWHHSSTSKRAAFDANHQYAFHPAPLSPQHSSSVSSLFSNCLQSQLGQIICDHAGGENPALVGGGVLEVRCISSVALISVSSFRSTVVQIGYQYNPCQTSYINLQIWCGGAL